MSPKKTASIDQQIQKIAEKAVDKAIEEREDPDSSEDSVLHSPLPGEAETEFVQMPDLINFPGESEIEYSRSNIENLLDNDLPQSGKGIFAKLYKIIGADKVLLLRIDDFTVWSDIESNTYEIVKAGTVRDPNTWGPGKYRIMFFSPRGKLISNPKEYTFANFSPPEPQPAPTSLSETDMLRKAIALQKELGIGQGQQPGDISKAISDAMKMGIDTIKGSIPVGKENDPSTQMTAMMTMMTGMMKMFAEIGAFGNKNQHDPFEVYMRMKELEKKYGREAEDVDSVSKTLQLINELRPLIESGAGGRTEEPSLLFKALEILGPKIPDMIGNITGAVKAISDASKLKLMHGMGGMGQPSPMANPNAPAIPSASPPMPSPAGISELPAGVITEQETKEVQEAMIPMNPIIREIVDAIGRKDSTFYPKLEEILKMWVNPMAVNQLTNGIITVEAFLGQASQMLQVPYLNSPNAHEYMKAFIESKKLQSLPTINAADKLFAAKCEKCGAEFEWDNQEMFEAEPNKTCEDCSGNLVPITEGTSTVTENKKEVTSHEPV